ncbi:MAG: Signal transduction histidine kinase containing Cache and PAS domain [Candidatus Methanohalarchaeum thermophilum]|uniref:Signal transduction histidine kinase containing Cache and PAS domain n=1 Tax=Methanohalarchaeum thermophilum TaxID=1903181 RepID=A0A1Q6DT33_METT1|nr:MAG: Signal transduction histidine kinase containing Cache and PAS domain [Candidatus Methanohalarchaeum thermophilum]
MWSRLTDSISKKLILTIAVVAIVIFSGMTLLVVNQATGQQKEVAGERMQEMTQSYANDFNVDMKRYMETAKTLTLTLEKYQKSDASREEVVNML